MGTSTPVKLPAVNLTMTPEDCSAEVLRSLFGYLPEEIRGDGDTGTVITVPAAFNQMQKDSTMAAAEAAGLGRVALMQEPVAAVMSVMRQRKNDGVFVVYDLGGGTLDIAIAESIAGRVNLLAHGGIAMCGERRCPIVRAATRLNPDQTRLQASEERQDLIALELLAKHRGSALVDAVNLEHVLGKVQSEGRDSHSCLRWQERARSPAQTVAAGGRSRKGASIPLTLHL